MTVPYSLVIIKPLSIGRGEGPILLQSILEDCPVSLRLFRSWAICDTTLFALTQNKDLYDSSLVYETEHRFTLSQAVSWIGVFTHRDRNQDPTEILEDYCGPLERTLWLPHHLRYRFGGFPKLGLAAHASDTVVHIAKPERVVYESHLLFLDFNETTL